MLTHLHHLAYVVADMDHAIGVFRDTLGPELIERRVAEGAPSFEMATFQCGPTIVELQRPIDYPELSRFLEDNGPGLNHVAFAVPDLAQAVEELEATGVRFEEPGAFVAGTGWKIANFDLGKCDLPYFASKYHDDHLAGA